MRRNIAKVSALIMAATTGMSTMMPAATTVAWANETATQATQGTVTNVVADWASVDWNAEEVKVKITYSFEGSDKTFSAEATVTNYVLNDAHETGNYAVAVVETPDLGRRTFTCDVPEDTKHYATSKHVYVEKSEWITEPTCTEGGRKHVWELCEADNTIKEDSDKDVDVAALGHAYGEWEVDYNAPITNIKTDKDGKIVFDEKGNPVVIDNKQNASYTLKHACTREGCGEEETKLITIAASQLEELPSTLVAGENTVIVTENGKQKAVLVDHTKAGKYQVQHWYKDGNGVTTEGQVDDMTLEPAHTWSETFTVDRNYKYEDGKTTQNLITAGKLTVKTDAKGNEYVVNNDCAKEIVVRYVQKCTDPYDNEEKDAINEETAKLETVKPTGAHKYTVVTDEKATPVDEKKHVYKQHKECVECGATEEVEVTEDMLEDHESAYKKENLVEPTCAKEGSFDLVEYCPDCGYELDRKTVTLAKTDDHDWEDVSIEWPAEGSYLINGYNELTFSTHQHCKNCGAENETNEGTATVRYAYQSEGTVERTFDMVDENGDVTDSVDGYWLEYKVVESVYSCKPGTIEVTVYTMDENDEKKVIDTKEYDYYSSLYDYKHMSDHVDGKTEIVTDEDGVQHKITYCAKCGTAFKDEIVEPEKTLGQVENLKAATYGTSTIITWDALEGADGYIVVAINSKAQGQQIGYTSTTSFVDENAKSEDYNYYWVIPYFKNAEGKIVKGELTGYKYAIAQTEMNVVAETAENGVALTWDAVDGATSYIVKAKAASDKAATVIATVTDTEYVDVNASADEFTFYWVFPCYTNAAGKTVVGTIDASQYVYGIANAVDAE